MTEVPPIADTAQTGRSPKTRRVFFALWPDERVRRALAAVGRKLRDECRGRLMRDHNLHLTLVFIGNVEAERVTDLKRVGASVAGNRFDLALDTLNYWRHNRIVWAGASLVPGALVDLVARLEAALRRGGFAFDARPYVPHMTLLRNALRAPMSSRLESVVWPAGAFALVESVRDDGQSRYEVLENWPLGPAYNRVSGPPGITQEHG